jgi:hypothetical protein
MKRTARIATRAEEQTTSLARRKTLILSSIDPLGYPHSVGTRWSPFRGVGHMTTFRKSQKAKNLRCSSEISLLAESGVTYAELRGLMVRGRGEILEDTDLCASLADIQSRYFDTSDPSASEALRPQASNRVVMRIRAERVSSRDHSKLGGIH